MKHIAILAAVLSVTTIARAADDKRPAPANALEEQWEKLVTAKDGPKAKALCEGWLTSKEVMPQTEAHKCLADVSMSQGKTDEALAHLESAFKLTPTDVNAHDAQLQILMWSRRYAEMPAALERALKDCGKEGLESWLDYSAGLLDEEHFEAGLDYTRILEKNFPKDYRVQADMGALLAASKNYEAALPYMKKAVALKPDDALDNWNLGRVYDELDKAALAEKQYRKALSLDVGDKKQEYECLFSEFLKKRKRPGAAKYEAQHCPGGAPDDD